MWKTIALILPILVPSWRFFKTIDPSPRVQWVLTSAGADAPKAPLNWQEFRPRPAYLSPLQMFRRLFWNPVWNESLFLVSCAERIQECPTDHSINEIRQRILREIMRIPASVTKTGTTESSTESSTTDKMLQFRLLFVHRDGAQLTKEVLFISERFPVTGRATH